MALAKLKLGLVFSAALLLVSCGSPAPPLPPSLELPEPVRDFRAVRKGDKVTLTWTVPAQTTEQRNIRRPIEMEICRAFSQLQQCGIPLATVHPQKLPTSKTSPQQLETYTDQLSQSLQFENPTANLVYAVNVLNSYGRTAGLSNHARVPAAPTLAAPENLEARVTAEGIRLTWQPISNPPQISGLHFAYRVYRREEGTATEIVAGEVPVENDPSPVLVDGSFEWEKTYDYHITVVSLITQPNVEAQQVEGDDSPPTKVVAHDVFPPAVPSGLQVVSSGPGQKTFIDLIWNPDTDSDLAGYNVYRRETGGEWVKINSELVKSSAFRDDAIAAAHAYDYSVSAVDVRGNESARSEGASVAMPSPN
jgi:hypothetical protein